MLSRLISVLGWGALVLSGCVEPITLDGAYQRRLVAEGIFLERQPPALQLSTTVSRTQPDSFPPVEDALVQLAGGGEVLSLLSLGGGQYATDEVRLQAGQNWQVHIDWEGKSYEAEVRLPQRLATLDSLSHSERVDSTGRKRSRLTLHFTVLETHLFSGFWSLYRSDSLLSEGSLQGPLSPGVGFQNFEVGDLLPAGTEVRLLVVRVDEGFLPYLQAIGNSNGLPVIGGLTVGPPANPPGNLSNGALGYLAGAISDTLTLVIP